LTAYLVTIGFFGSFITLSILLAWARSIKKYWVREMSRNGDASDKQDANANEEE
jgi:hypothetical protein